jgi:hypothetical protein
MLIAVDGTYADAYWLATDLAAKYEDPGICQCQCPAPGSLTGPLPSWMDRGSGRLYTASAGNDLGSRTTHHRDVAVQVGAHHFGAGLR